MKVEDDIQFHSAIEAQPPFTINPRWVKKVTYKVKGVIPCD